MNGIKKLILILGANGVGKTTTAQALLSITEKCAYVDSDWCRVTNPFSLSGAIGNAVTDNIYCLLRNYLICDDINTVIFTYGFHGGRKKIFDQVISRLSEENIVFDLCPVILKCSREENIARALRDGRDKERIERGISATFGFYDNYAYPKIDTTALPPARAAEKIAGLFTPRK